MRVPSVTLCSDSKGLMSQQHCAWVVFGRIFWDVLAMSVGYPSSILMMSQGFLWSILALSQQGPCYALAGFSGYLCDVLAVSLMKHACCFTIFHFCFIHDLSSTFNKTNKHKYKPPQTNIQIFYTQTSIGKHKVIRFSLLRCEHTDLLNVLVN